MWLAITLNTCRQEGDGCLSQQKVSGGRKTQR